MNQATSNEHSGMQKLLCNQRISATEIQTIERVLTAGIGAE
jgi:hypothetical protein